MSEDQRFRHGVAVGVAATAVVVAAWLAVELTGARDMYRDFGGDLPLATRVVLAPAWRWGVPGVGACAVAALVALRPRRLWSYALIAGLLVSTTIATYYEANAPIRALAGNIKE